jgi:hypothetical protein
MMNAAVLLYGTLYAIHSVRNRRWAGAVVCGAAGLLLIALSAAVLWLERA